MSDFHINPNRSYPRIEKTPITKDKKEQKKGKGKEKEIKNTSKDDLGKKEKTNDKKGINVDFFA